MHSLSHLCKEREEHDVIDDFNAFSYKNRMKSIKDSLNSSYKPLQQIARRDLQGKEKMEIVLNSELNKFVLSLKHYIAVERVTAKLAHFWSRDFGTELCAK